MKDILLGIDIGTTGTKCTFYNLEGKMVASAYQEYPMLHPHPSWAEQDPNRWWKAVCENLRNCFNRQGIDNKRVAAIGVSCTNAVVLVNKNGEALGNALGLHDQRSEDQLTWLKEHVEEDLILNHSGNRLAKGSFALPRLKWFQQCMPETFKNAYKFLTPGGYIIQHLTGKFVINHSRANLTLLANIYTGQWDEAILSAVEFPHEILPECVPTCTVVGCVTKAAAEATGLLEGTPVSAGAVDTVQATLAAGAVAPGDLAITIGSSGRVCYISDKPIIDRKLLNCESPIPGYYTIIQTTDNAGVSLRWFRDTFGDVLSAKAKENGVSIYHQMDIEASSVPEGANGMIYLPYLSGEQSPIWNPAARGVFFNISLESTYGSFVRAVLEGVAFSIKDCLNLVLNHAREPEFIPIGGGVANSDLWCQIFADILGYPIVKMAQPETETLGDIITAAESIGLPQIHFDFGKKIAARSKIFTPNEQTREMYEAQFLKYKSIYGQLKDEFL